MKHRQLSPDEKAFRRLYRALSAVARLPLGVLYGLSSLVAPVLYHAVRYRRRVVHDNLTACYPDLTAKQIRKIEKDFYRFFTDYVVESMHMMRMTQAEAMERITFEGVEIMDEYLAQGRHVACYFSHCGCWEWAASMPLHSRYSPAREGHQRVVFGQIYSPLHDAAFNRLMLVLRRRFGSTSIAKHTVLRHFVDAQRRGLATATGFMADQRPTGSETRVETTFLGRPTAFIRGTEDLARRLDMAAVYWDISRPARGIYHVTIRRMADSVAATPEGEVTKTYVKLLQQTIGRNPAIWLWSHKRWKNQTT